MLWLTLFLSDDGESHPGRGLIGAAPKGEGVGGSAPNDVGIGGGGALKVDGVGGALKVDGVGGALKVDGVGGALNVDGICIGGGSAEKDIGTGGVGISAPKVAGVGGVSDEKDIGTGGGGVSGASALNPSSSKASLKLPKPVFSSGSDLGESQTLSFMSHCWASMGMPRSPCPLKSNWTSASQSPLRERLSDINRGVLLPLGVDDTEETGDADSQAYSSKLELRLRRCQLGELDMFELKLTLLAFGVPGSGESYPLPLARMPRGVPGSSLGESYPLPLASMPRGVFDFIDPEDDLLLPSLLLDRYGSG